MRNNQAATGERGAAAHTTQTTGESSMQEDLDTAYTYLAEVREKLTGVQMPFGLATDINGALESALSIVAFHINRMEAEKKTPAQGRG